MGRQDVRRRGYGPSGPAAADCRGHLASHGPPGHIERICQHAGILRVGGAFGEPWSAACVLRFDSADQVTVEAVERAPSPGEWRAALEVMRAAGIRTVTFQRRRAGIVSTRTITVRERVD